MVSYQIVFKFWGSACVFLTTKHTNRKKKRVGSKVCFCVLKADCYKYGDNPDFAQGILPTLLLRGMKQEK